ncbi:hypothetical protein HYQ46_003273 [Verticillium longisporum]|nr:hypothetical protein HYQ46_003273 [Verticillium longisporum]
MRHPPLRPERRSPVLPGQSMRGCQDRSGNNTFELPSSSVGRRLPVAADALRPPHQQAGSALIALTSAEIIMVSEWTIHDTS